MSKIDSLLTSNGFRGESDISGINCAMVSLCEKHFIEKDFAYSTSARSLYINEPCNLFVAIGGSDLISIASVTAGLSVGEALNMAAKAEELLDRELSFSYSEKIGYLSPSPKNCGSGLTFSALLYLPSLRLFGRTELVRRALCDRGISLSPLFSYAEEKNDLYLISFTPYRFADESAAASLFSDAISALCDNESKTLGIILSEKGKIIYAQARRALGALLYCESISECEMLDLISAIRLSRCISNEETCSALPSFEELNFLCSEGLNASVAASAKEGCNSIEECDILRAELIKKYINHKSEVS